MVVVTNVQAKSEDRKRGKLGANKTLVETVGKGG